MSRVDSHPLFNLPEIYLRVLRTGMICRTRLTPSLRSAWKHFRHRERTGSLPKVLGGTRYSKIPLTPSPSPRSSTVEITRAEKRIVGSGSGRPAPSTASAPLVALTLVLGAPLGLHRLGRRAQAGHPVAVPHEAYPRRRPRRGARPRPQPLRHRRSARPRLNKRETQLARHEEHSL